MMALSNKLRVLISPKVGGNISSMKYNYREWVDVCVQLLYCNREERQEPLHLSIIPFSNKTENGDIAV